MKKRLLSGNEAIALGAWEAGVTAATGYPGTPSTEILENISAYPEVTAEWSVNEKVAFEVAMGASLGGARTLVTMKHVGLNVAADALFTSAYIGVKGGLVVVSADDPDMNSSQNEQDNRHYGYAAKVPLLEPSDSEEAYEFTKLAFELSEKYDTPVILRTTTRINHSKTVVSSATGVRKEVSPSGFERNMPKYVMIPAYARPRHAEVEKRLARIKEDCNSWKINRAEYMDLSMGFVTSGIAYHYLRENFPEASVLKLGILNPLPEKLVLEFASKVSELFVVEELDPYLEMRLKALGLKVRGKDIFPLTGELNQDIIRRAVTGERPKANPVPTVEIPPRLPTLCPGCPHRMVFQLLNKHKLTVTGDIGCYTLGVLPPFSAMDTCVEMGASIGMAQGLEIAAGKGYKGNVVAVIGDSTFAHSGVTGLINAAYNRRNSLIIVLDNGITAMTGMQHNPLSGKTLSGDETARVDYRKLADAVGIAPDSCVEVNAFREADIEKALLRLLESKKLSLLVARGPCIIAKGKGTHMTDRTYNILMVGVGGQGIVLASDILCLAAMNAGYDTKKSEIHGMSQRGGSIFSFVRFGKKIHSPVISAGQADILVSMEEMETLRWLDYASPRTSVLMADTRILPAGTKHYPKGILEYLKSEFGSVRQMDTAETITRIGNPKYLNVHFLGIISKSLPLSDDDWKRAIRESVPEKHFENNLAAFTAGRE